MAVEDFTIRPYRPGDEEGILSSFNLVFREVCGEGYVDRDLDFWRWEFTGNPWGHRIVVAIAPDGTVAAQYAAVPLPMVTAHGRAVFVQGVDSFAHPDYRRGLKRPGLFVQTAMACLDACRARHESWFGYPVIAAERIGKRFLNYERVRVVDYLCRDLKLPEPPVDAAISLERLTALPGSEVDDLFVRMQADKQCLVERSAAYLDWRYLCCPGDLYEIWAARRGGELCGLVVLRPEHELIPGACTIADWLAPGGDATAAAALVAAAHRVGVTHGRERLLAVFPDNSPEHAMLRELGFEVVPSADYMARPLIIGLCHPEMTVPWLAEHWWYTLGDSDLV